MDGDVLKEGNKPLVRGPFLDALALGLLVFLSLLYLVFKADFAEFQVKFSFLPFPIFVGEIVMFVCGILFCLKWKIERLSFRPQHRLILSYFFLVALRALHDDRIWGPLAFRTAALFYYPIFIVFGYYFFNPKSIDRRLIIGAWIILALGLLGRFIADYYQWPCFILLVMLIGQCRNKFMYAYGFTVLGYLLMMYYFFCPGTRAHIIGLAFSVIFLASYIVWGVYGRSRWLRYALATILVVGIILGVTRFSDSNAVKSMLALGSLGEVFQQYDAQVKTELVHYEQKPMGVNLFNSDQEWKLKIEDDRTREANQKASIRNLEIDPDTGEPIKGKRKAKPAPPSEAIPLRPAVGKEKKNHSSTAPVANQTAKSLTGKEKKASKEKMSAPVVEAESRENSPQKNVSSVISNKEISVSIKKENKAALLSHERKDVSENKEILVLMQADSPMISPPVAAAEFEGNAGRRANLLAFSHPKAEWKPV